MPDDEPTNRHRRTPAAHPRHALEPGPVARRIAARDDRLLRLGGRTGCSFPKKQNWNQKQDGIAFERERWAAPPSPREENAAPFTDDTLRLMFVCFHPQLSAEVQVALALRTLCGFSLAEIAAAFLTTEAAIAKRLVRAELCHEALRLALLLAAHPATRQPPVTARPRTNPPPTGRAFLISTTTPSG